MKIPERVEEFIEETVSKRQDGKPIEWYFDPVEHGPKLTKAFTETDQQAREETAKAYGGCKNCYGKGYATVKDFTVGHEDFGGEGFVEENNPMRFCKCDRGKQLEALINPPSQV